MKPEYERSTLNGSVFSFNFAHCIYILVSSACRYKIFIINKVFTEFCLLISAFYYITT